MTKLLTFEAWAGSCNPDSIPVAAWAKWRCVRAKRCKINERHLTRSWCCDKSNCNDWNILSRMPSGHSWFTRLPCGHAWMPCGIYHLIECLLAIGESQRSITIVGDFDGWLPQSAMSLYRSLAANDDLERRRGVSDTLLRYRAPIYDFPSMATNTYAGSSCTANASQPLMIQKVALQPIVRCTQIVDDMAHMSYTLCGLVIYSSALRPFII